MTGRTEIPVLTDRGITPDSPRILVAPAGKVGVIRTVREYVPLVRDGDLQHDHPGRWAFYMIAFDSFLASHLEEYELPGVQHNLGRVQKETVDWVREFCRLARESLP